MADTEPIDPDDIDSVAVEPDHCHRCGTALGSREWEGREHPWCPNCDLVLSRNPVAGVHVVVHDDERVLVLDEPIPQHEGVLSLPGGFARPDEGPKVAGLRELEEETGLRGDPGDIEFLTVHHAEFPDAALYLLTYAVRRADVEGELTAEFDDGEARFEPFADLQAEPDRIRDSDLERIGLAFDE
ncbi:NUDIX hydrolase [Halostella salina]|uniref:NUDIX hydrolase n=1 Tax=Halostella salina TaxID=1547897 RepID=UPI000EF7D5BA|nr:NUDIX domain-containing protein [Halostella salina]